MRKFKSVFYPHWLGPSPGKELASSIKQSSPYTFAKKTKEGHAELQDFEEVEILSGDKKGANNELQIRKNSQSETVNS